MDPTFAAYLAAVEALAVAKRAGRRVTQRQCAIAAAGTVLALGVTRDELYAEAGPLAQEQAWRTIDRLLAESDARRKAAS